MKKPRPTATRRSPNHHHYDLELRVTKLEEEVGHFGPALTEVHAALSRFENKMSNGFAEITKLIERRK